MPMKYHTHEMCQVPVVVLQAKGQFLSMELPQRATVLGDNNHPVGDGAETTAHAKCKTVRLIVIEEEVVCVFESVAAEIDQLLKIVHFRPASKAV